LADATTPQTVAVSPTWRAASSARGSAALAGSAHSPNTAEAAIIFTPRIAVSASVELARVLIETAV
jgi:hypothetical protein